MVTFLCYNFFELLYSRFFPNPNHPLSPPPANPALSSPSKSPEKPFPQHLEPTQNLEVLADKNFSYLTVDEKYFSHNELAFYKDKYPSPTRKPSTKIRWKPGDFLGQGSFGTVVMGFNAVTGEIMAVKQVNLEGNESNEKVSALQSEIELLMQFEHPNIVRYLGTTRSQKRLNIFLEYISGGSIAYLLKKYGKFNESIVRQYTLQILKGLEYLHWNKVLHRDIKGANVLVDNKGVCKLADFGSSKRINDLCNTEQNSLTGTANWMAPEVIRQSVVSRYSDIWSLGCTIIEMVTGKPPWSEYNNPLTTMFYIAKSNEPPKLPDNLSPDLVDFLQNCLKIIPGERANCRQLLEHRFISGKQPFFQNLEKSQSPPLRRKIQEKEQDFFEIKLRENENGNTSPEFQWDKSVPYYQNNNDIASHQNHQNNDNDHKKESSERRSSRSLFDTILVKLKSKTNSEQSNNTLHDETPKAQNLKEISRKEKEKKEKEKEKEKKVDTSIELKQQKSNRFMKKKSYEFFTASNPIRNESQRASYSNSKEKLPLSRESYESELKNSDTKIKYQENSVIHGMGSSGIRHDNESERGFVDEKKVNHEDVRF